MSINAGWVSSLVVLCLACRAGNTVPPTEAVNAYAPQPLVGDVGSVYFTIRNHMPVPDTVTGVDSPVAAQASIHSEHAGVMHGMSMVVVPPNGSIELRPGVMHLMLEGIRLPYVVGDSIHVVVHLKRSGALSIMVPVVDYAAIDTLLDGSTR